MSVNSGMAGQPINMNWQISHVCNHVLADFNMRGFRSQVRSFDVYAGDAGTTLTTSTALDTSKYAKKIWSFRPCDSFSGPAASFVLPWLCDTLGWNNAIVGAAFSIVKFDWGRCRFRHDHGVAMNPTQISEISAHGGCVLCWSWVGPNSDIENAENTTSDTELPV